MKCGSCGGTGHLRRRWQRGPRQVCGGCNGSGRYPYRRDNPKRRVSASAPKHFSKAE